MLPKLLAGLSIEGHHEEALLEQRHLLPVADARRLGLALPGLSAADLPVSTAVVKKMPGPAR
ncbi:MAG: hypothetical protein R2748_26025 [Bryobacterales bacterium]